MKPGKIDRLNSTCDAFVNVALRKHPIKEIAGHIDDRFMGYGTANDEKVFGLDGFTWMVERQWEEMDISRTEIKQHPVARQLFNGDNSALIVEEIEILVHEHKETVPMSFRLSTLLEYNGKKWMILHFHGSIGDANTLEGNAWPIEELKRRNIELEQQVAEKTADLVQQNRELEIEAALERVRARSMAMQKSEELAEVVRQLKEKIMELGIDIENTQIGIDFTSDPNDGLNDWVAVEGRRYLEKFHIPFIDHPITAKFYETLNNDLGTFTAKYSKSEKNAYFKLLFEHSDFKDTPEERKNSILNAPGWVICGVILKNSSMQFARYNLKEFTREEIEIFKRFGKVFGQVYIRFLDLQKAEEQAREAQIEAALERVRSHTMAMQRSEDMAQTASEMFRQIETLGMHPWGCGFNIFDENEKAVTQYMSLADGGMSPPFRTPLTEDSFFINIYDARQRKEELLVMESSGESLAETYRYMFGLPGSGEIFGDLENSGFEMPKYQITHCAYFSQGYLVFITYEAVPEAHAIFMRFAKVFEQTYTRFLDLKKAEKLALETARQSSLDRIRAEIGSMRRAEDLQQITPIIWDELKTLDIPFIRCGVFIIDEKNGVSHTYLSTSKGEPIAALHLPMESISLVENIRDSWSSRQIYTVHWDKKDFSKWTQNLVDRGFIESKKKYEAGSAPETLDLHFLPFKQGMLYIGNTEPLSKKNLDLGQSIADTFSVAYNRYEDFNKLEQAKQKIEEAFRELEAAKDQLVQQEKLASLGQLTAGIAHEIKNPLNFVNNFSDLSIELVEEAREEMKEKLSADSHQLTAVFEILDDIEGNLRKINEHGTRADSIVKSMLQHSRGSSGKMEPTNVNTLIKEYANLAFHGMRAGKDPINVDIELELDDSVGDVQMVAEDFSRVILNLCNNAFDAMREKLSENAKMKSEKSPLERSGGAERSRGVSSSGEYEPKLTVRTHRNDDTVTIKIEDNGPGIPEAIIDKILQPFFTTKKGTAGTGLGLSITNDIIKAHGGVLEIESKENQFTRFTIHINTK